MMLKVPYCLTCGWRSSISLEKQYIRKHFCLIMFMFKHQKSKFKSEIFGNSGLSLQREKKEPTFTKPFKRHVNQQQTATGCKSKWLKKIITTIAIKTKQIKNK